MKHIIFFITHSTLNEINCELTFKSISMQQMDNKFDIMYIYNTHQHELPNDNIINLYNKYNLHNYINELKIFNYNDNGIKSLAYDIGTISNYCINTYNNNDRILFLKSDILLSKNYFNTIFNLTDNNEKAVFFTSPFICAKKRVSNDEILHYINRDTFIKSDYITFFVEDYQKSNNTDFYNRKNINITDNQIKFTSCYVICDWSCHLISTQLLNLLKININNTWGGVNLSLLVDYFYKTDNCFTVHKYHDILSENRKTNREGPVHEWLNS
jgi:hypothetical protein